MTRKIAAAILFCLAACSSPEVKSANNTPGYNAEPIDLSIAPFAGEFVWTVDHDNSSIQFEAVEKRVSFKGRLERFNIAVDMDPENPKNGRIEALIDIGSVNAGNADRDETLGTPEWFYPEKYPLIRFQSNTIIRTGPEAYTATGILSVKDVENEIVLPFTLVQNGKEALAIAKYEFNRLDYRIGIGSFSDEKYVGYPVKILITINANQLMQTNEDL